MSRIRYLVSDVYYSVSVITDKISFSWSLAYFQRTVVKYKPKMHF